MEVQSGKDHENRPVLRKAIDLAASNGYVILVSRLCRLSRDLEFTAALMKNNRVKFRIATNPNADEFSIAIYAAMALQERKMISMRTKSALAAAKKRGVKLGIAGIRNIKKANEAKVLKANRFAETIRPLVKPLRQSGKTYMEIANILNSLGIKTPQGKSFFASSVQRYAARF